MNNEIIHTYGFTNLEEYKLFTSRHGPIRTKTLPPQTTEAILLPILPPFELEGKFLFRMFYSAPCPSLTLSHDAFYTECFKKSFATLKAYKNLYRGYTQRFELSKCSKTHRILPRIVIRNCLDLFFRFGLPHYQWKSHWTITIRSATRCVLLHFDSSKRCVCSLYAFKVVSYLGERASTSTPVSQVGGGTVKKELKKEVETVANNYPR
jgi:hypothetical protein